MDREIINRILDEYQDVRNSFATGGITPSEYRSRCDELNARLNVFGLGLTVSMATPPF